MPRLVSLKRHPYESIARDPGVEYDATAADARLLVLAGNARYKDGGGAQTYQTRDIVAGTSTPRRRRAAKALAA